MIAAPVSLVPGWPANRSVPAASQRWPGVTPWTGDSAGAVEQAARRAGANSTNSRINGLFLGNSAHLELAVFDGEGEPPLHQVERVAAKLLVAPALHNIEVLAHPCG